jgi:hypothetical protein
MKLIYKLSAAIFILGSLISVWFLLANQQSIQPASSAFLVCVLIGACLAVKVFNKSLIIRAKEYALNIVKRKYFVVAALLLLTMTFLEQQ